MSNPFTFALCTVESSISPERPAAIAHTTHTMTRRVNGDQTPSPPRTCQSIFAYTCTICSCKHAACRPRPQEPNGCRTRISSAALVHAFGRTCSRTETTRRTRARTRNASNAGTLFYGTLFGAVRRRWRRYRRQSMLMICDRIVQKANIRESAHQEYHRNSKICKNTLF